jgi:Spy/CpxP family protein refolding chaperone
LLLGGALVFAAGQSAQAAPPAPAKAASAPAGCDEGMCPWHGGERGHGHHHKGDHKARQGQGMKGDLAGGLPFAGPGFERLLDDVKATEAQRKQIREITDKARTDLRALHDKAQAQHHSAMAIWTSPKLDAAEAEKQRQQMLAQHDQVSKRMMQAMLDVGQVLTPEQRAKAAATLQQRREGMQERLAERKERREQAREEAREERLQNHKLRRQSAPPAASAPAAASQATPSR